MVKLEESRVPVDWQTYVRAYGIRSRLAGTNFGIRSPEFRIREAVWSTAEIDDLPDSAFAVIEPGGSKDSEGKTIPRSLRHLPYKDKNGNVDLPHLRNALARLPFTQIPESLKAVARKKLEEAAKDHGVGSEAMGEQEAKEARSSFVSHASYASLTSRLTESAGPFPDEIAHWTEVGSAHGFDRTKGSNAHITVMMHPDGSTLRATHDTGEWEHRTATGQLIQKGQGAMALHYHLESQGKSSDPDPVCPPAEMDEARFSQRADLPLSVIDALDPDQQQTYLDAFNAESDGGVSDDVAHDKAMQKVHDKHENAPDVENPFRPGIERSSTMTRPGQDMPPLSAGSADPAHPWEVNEQSAFGTRAKPRRRSQEGLDVRNECECDCPECKDCNCEDCSHEACDCHGCECDEGMARQAKEQFGTHPLPLAAREAFDAVEFITEAGEVSGIPSTESGHATSLGWVWETEMLKPGLSLNGTMYYTPEFIRGAARDFEGAPSYADHQATASGSVRNLIGTFRNVRADQGTGNREQGTAGGGSDTSSLSPSLAPVLRGQLHILESEDWMRQKLLAAQKAKMPMGLSINAIVGLRKAVRTIQGEPREVMEPVKLIPNTPRSVDVVTFPAAGGRILRAVAGDDFRSALETARKYYQAKSRKPMANGYSLLASANPGSTRATQGGTMNGHNPPATGAGVITEELVPIAQEVTELRHQIEQAQRRQRSAESALLINQKLTQSKLPTPLANLVRERFQGAIVSAAELDREIARVREAYAAVVPSPAAISGRAAAVISEPIDRQQIALNKLLGIHKDEFGNTYDASIPAFRGIQEAYIVMTGDRNLDWTPSASSRVTEDWSAAGFANALGNSIYRRLIADYREVDYGLDLICPPREPHRVALKDFRTHNIIRVGYLGDLVTVDPEQTDWPEITPPTDEEAQITAVQFGGLVSVTRKTVINDDLGLVAKVASRLGRTARRTMAQRLYNLMINNVTIYDGSTFFNSTTHNNLGSTPLSSAEISNVRTALRNQTEKDSGKKLGIAPYLLVVPNELEGTAKSENERQYVDNNFTPNKVQFIFGRYSERVIVNPILTETDDWYVFADPDDVQTFEIGFLQGKAEPELLLADNQLVGKAFTSDRIQYKIRHEYEVAVVDYRGAYKEVV